MAQLTVGTTAVDVLAATGRGRPIIQNLGPGKLYFDSAPNVTTSTGIQLAVGASYEFASAISLETGLSVIADQAATDVRVIVMGA